ncbi:DUF3558 family protein [Rhodococcoides yunnanense]|uniref:DUF3558 family protein n=1 Tax=Rhodococcoides yunnanense TaxID=278209 RepID=UPI00147658E3|nr:DUF3558 family protein [Rhodococcus yunnanensis]
MALCGCGHTIEGNAVAEDAWRGQGVERGQLPSSSESSPSAQPAEFDPCGLDDDELKILGVDPATKIEIPAIGACSWSGDGIGFSVSLAGPLPLDSIATTTGVTDLREVVVGGRIVKVFVYSGDTCAAFAEVEGGTVEFTMIDAEFDSSCSRLEVAVELFLEHP